MANDVTSNPWVIDTTGAGLIWTGNIKVDHFEFAGYAADTDQVVVNNKAGKLVWAENGASDLRTVRGGTVGWVFGGMSVPTLTAGSKLLVYIK